HGQQSPEGIAASQEQGPDDDQREDDVEQHRPFWPVLAPLADDRTGNRDSETDDEQAVEPEASRQRPELLHGLKVLRTASLRLVRANDPKIVRWIETESASRMKTSPHPHA